MACLDMYNQNSEHKGHGAPMSPRISFSNDFAESSHSHHHQMIKQYPRDAPVSSDFEFSVANHSMMSADELFFKGRLLPFKTNKTTLREELLTVDDDEGNVSVRPPKGSAMWKGLLGLRKSHIGSKKADKNDGSVQRRSGLVHEEAHFNKASQEGG